MEIPEPGNTVTEIKSLVDKLNSRMEGIEPVNWKIEQ